VEVVEQYSLAAQFIDGRGFDGGIAGEGHITVALIVGNHDDDVGLFRFLGKD